ncbi:hypothetical protein HG535_0C04770 [Zygotorulaspora mrakii]|uniref:Uncharacterized protein n=1 Tax=Zygotorulaspora mrakii TaxID=42260 RepID=A0A7H9B0T0_ZYGMR|nr:uncharacterized protein HG535_0C04770 [Zygotorulaspora mrakii]QLG72123.1 hypothetical protein HG535_0C04770 [Zygotorulaspora mrakii]
MSNGDREVYSCDLKLVLLGESSVGKSSIVMRYTIGTFQKCNATIGAAYTTKAIEKEGDNGTLKRVNLEIWDTAGQERYRSLAPMYYRNTDVALIVFDLTKPESLRKANSWIEELQSYVEQDRRDDICIILVGNKNDIEHEEFQMNKNIVKVSALTGEGINELFESIIDRIPAEKYNKCVNSKNNNGIKLDQSKNETNSSGCNC